MKKFISFFTILFVIASLFGCNVPPTPDPGKTDENKTINPIDSEAVKYAVSKNLEKDYSVDLLASIDKNDIEIETNLITEIKIVYSYNEEDDLKTKFDTAPQQSSLANLKARQTFTYNEKDKIIYCRLIVIYKVDDKECYLYGGKLTINLEDYVDLTPKPAPVDFSSAIAYVDGLMPTEASSNITLPTSFKDIKIYWDSNSTFIAPTGIFRTPYSSTEVTLTASFYKDEQKETKEYKIMALGQFKELTNGIASGYIYRSYDLLTDEFFETMDIIYCAFILLNDDATIQANTKTISNINKYVLPKAHQNGDWVVVSIGGGGSEPAATFSKIAASPELRKKLAQNLVNLVNKYGYDGIDIDWEKPANAEEGKNFTLLMEEIYNAIKGNNENHLITAAITGGKYQPPCYDLTNSGKYLDYINVMTYGMCSSSGQYHTALYKSSSYNDATNKVGCTGATCSMDESVTIFNGYNVPSSKLIFGLAFYGVSQTLENGKWKSSGSVMYTKIKEELLPSGDYKYVYDAKAGVAYIINKTGTYFVNYDDPTSIKAKCDYVLKNDCAGVMYWENGCDTTGDLVHAIKEGLNK